MRSQRANFSSFDNVDIIARSQVHSFSDKTVRSRMLENQYFRDGNFKRLGVLMRQFTPSMASSKSKLSNTKSNPDFSLMLQISPKQYNLAYKSENKSKNQDLLKITPLSIVVVCSFD